MNLKSFFKPIKNTLEGAGAQSESKKEQLYNCPSCKKGSTKRKIRAAWYRCPYCGYYMKITARTRIRLLVDEGTFSEHGINAVTSDPIEFPGYDQKLIAAKAKSKENEGVICGEAEIGGVKCCIFSMEAEFMMGSMGTVVGDKIASLFEYATEKSLPVIGVTVSGGARMQEGVFSLCQMAKVSGAVQKHSDGGNFYLVLLTNPTTGGVTASFGMLGDVIVAEPGALISFAGPRVIEQSLKQKLPEGFQRAEAVQKCGFVDAIVAREDQKEYIAKMLHIHKGAKI